MQKVISELQSKRKHATVWIKMRFKIRLVDKIQKAHEGRWEEGLNKYHKYECESGWLVV